MPSFDFWGANWGWTGFYPTLKVDGPYRYTLSGTNKDLDFDLKADIQKPKPQTLTWDFDLQAHSRQSNVMGGGIVWRFDPTLIAGEMGDPVLLPDNRGWAWGKNPQGPRVEMRFDPPLAKVYFERGNTDQVRTFFYTDPIKPGQQQIKAQLSVTGDITIGQTATERFGMSDPDAWPDDQLDWRTSPVDLSFLNAPEKPAGKRGFVKAEGEQLVFADGTAVRFWGPTCRPIRCSVRPTRKSGCRPSACRHSVSTSCACTITTPWVTPTSSATCSRSRTRKRSAPSR